MHWAPYSLWDCCESWSICPEVWDWNRHDKMECWTSRNKDLKKFTEDYFDLYKQFDPVKFDPDAWAELAVECGFKHLNFTSKHHDGFCMWDTKTTDYKITNKDCPFHANPRANILKEVFDAFRKRGLAIECYFSKSDWHCPWYWLKDRPAEDRNPNYEPRENPEIWNQFKAYVHAQLMELVETMGRIDAFWMDGGQVRPPQQDIRMDIIVPKMRAIQPWLIMMDRTVGGVYENVITPECCVPEKPMGVPWQVNAQLTNNWKYIPGEAYKPAAVVVKMFLEILSKGGNLILNIGPKPDGTIPEGGARRLREIGAWVKANGEGIYATRVIAPYGEGPVRYTSKKDTVYAFVLPDEEGNFPKTVTLSLKPQVGAPVTLLEGGAPLAYATTPAGVVVTLPQGMKTLAVGLKFAR